MVIKDKKIKKIIILSHRENHGEMEKLILRRKKKDVVKTLRQRKLPNSQNLQKIIA